MEVCSHENYYYVLLHRAGTGRRRFLVDAAQALNHFPFASGEDIIYCCENDRRCFREHGNIHPADFLRVVWAAPGHAASWPFELYFSLMDEARWLEDILRAQGVEHPVLVGQSMGGYVAQAYCCLLYTSRCV